MRKIFLPLLLVALSPVAHSEGVQEVEIDAPLSGWHPAEGEDASFSQSINYPASSVNMADDQNISAQIRGNPFRKPVNSTFVGISVGFLKFPSKFPATLKVRCGRCLAASINS